MSYSRDEDFRSDDSSLTRSLSDIKLIGGRTQVGEVNSLVIYSPIESSTGIFDSVKDMDRYLSIDEDNAVKLEDII